MPLRLHRAAANALTAARGGGIGGAGGSRKAPAFSTRCYAAATATWPTARGWACCSAPTQKRVLLPQRRGFHGSRVVRNAMESKNHYERLAVAHGASPSQIKKSFYALSKTHHPDANPSDPNAAHKFSLISESYTILSHPDRRAAYDRDVLRLHHHQHSRHAGSYHSTSHNPAGGRTASGLSRRRGTFRGPPPSFYRSGGWGAHGEKRRAAHEESTGGGGGTAAAGSGATGHDTTSGSNRADPWAGAYGQTQYGGMGPGSDPFGHADEVPHFDKTGHTKTHRRQDERRWQRAKRAVGDDDIEFEPQMSLTGHFFVVAGILGVTFLAPLIYLQFMRFGRQKRDDE